MASHFSSIGFPVKTEAEFQRYARQALAEGEAIAAPAGRYVRWAVAPGVQLWLQIDREDVVIGLNPHFSGQALMRIGLTRRIAREGDSMLDGAFHGWADPKSDDPESGAYPMVFDAPDYDLHRALDLPAVRDVQLAAFAHQINAFASEEEYHAGQEQGLQFASKSFIPSGLFGADERSTDPPTATAIFTGHVLNTELLTNAVTGAAFHWAWVSTLGGEVDVVADPEVVNGRLVPGGVLSGSFWLSGQVLD